MEPSLFKYILTHSKRDQILLVLISLASLPLVYVTLELPKKIINLLEGSDVPDTLFGFELDRLELLMALSFGFLLVVLCSGGLKYLLNVYRGSLGEHLLRRLPCALELCAVASMAANTVEKLLRALLVAGVGCCCPIFIVERLVQLAH